MPRIAIRTDFTGQRFGRLVAQRYYCSDGSQKRYWVCNCDCGGKIVVTAYNLRSGNTRSCGCLLKEAAVKNNQKRVAKMRRNMSAIARANNINKETLYYHIKKGRTLKDALERIKSRKPLAS